MENLKNLEELTKQYGDAFTELIETYNEYGFGIYNESGDNNMDYYKELKEVCNELHIDTEEIEEEVFVTD